MYTTSYLCTEREYSEAATGNNLSLLKERPPLRSGMKFTNKMINTTGGGGLIRDEICIAHDAHTTTIITLRSANYYPRPCIGNYESFLQPFKRVRNIRTHICTSDSRARLSLDLYERRDCVCLVMCNESPAGDRAH